MLKRHRRRKPTENETEADKLLGMQPIGDAAGDRQTDRFAEAVKNIAQKDDGLQYQSTSVLTPFGEDAAKYLRLQLTTGMTIQLNRRLFFRKMTVLGRQRHC